MSHPNTDLIRKGFAAFAAGDMATLDAMMSDDVSWHTAGSGPVAGDFVGKEAVFGNFGQFVQEVDSFNQDLHAVLADDEHGVALVNVTLSRGGNTVTLQQTIVFHLAEGKVTEAWVSFHDQAASDAFWA